MVSDDILPAFSDALTQALPVQPALLKSFELSDPENRADYLIELRVEDRAYRLIVEEKRSNLFPRDVRYIISQLRRLVSREGCGPDIVVPVLIAGTISAGARQLLRDERVGYYDSSGSLFLSANGLYIFVDRQGSEKPDRSENNPFTASRAQVLHAAWVCGSEWFGVHQIAERAGVSPATASQTLMIMGRREWVEVRGAGPGKERRLINPGAMLDAWSEYRRSIKPEPVQKFYVRSVTPAVLQNKIDQVCEEQGIPYEFCDVTAGQIHAPYLSSLSQVFCRIPGGKALETVLSFIEARPVTEGWNLGIYKPQEDREFRFRQRLDGLWVADPLQTYLDLLHAGGRAKDLAKHLRAQKLEW